MLLSSFGDVHAEKQCLLRFEPCLKYQALGGLLMPRVSECILGQHHELIFVEVQVICHVLPNPDRGVWEPGACFILPREGWHLLIKVTEVFQESVESCAHGCHELLHDFHSFPERGKGKGHLHHHCLLYYLQTIVSLLIKQACPIDLQIHRRVGILLTARMKKCG